MHHNLLVYGLLHSTKIVKSKINNPARNPHAMGTEVMNYIFFMNKKNRNQFLHN